MKKIRIIASAALLTLTAFGATTLTSCTQECEIGYEGSNCKTLSRDKFVGTWNGNETCTIGTDNYQLSITAAGDDIKLNYSNLYNQGFSGQGTMTGKNTFSFTGNSGGTTWSGTGVLADNGQLTVTYTITAGTTNSCTFVGTK